MTDVLTRILGRPRYRQATAAFQFVEDLLDEAANEIDRLSRQTEELRDQIVRLQELLPGTGASRYWEGRWRDAEAEIERLTAERDEIARLRREFNNICIQYKLLSDDAERLRAEIERLRDERDEQSSRIGA